MFKLRKYQQTAVNNVLTGWRRKPKQLLAMATGTGKTVVIFAVLDAERQAENLSRVLYLVHRRELVSQAVDTCEKFFPSLGRPGVVMGDQDDYGANIVVATVQSLNSDGRLERVIKGKPNAFNSGNISHIVSDEAHHSIASTYRAVYAALPNALHLGVTATPRRTDEIALMDIFDEVAYKLSIKDAIKMGALCPFIARAVHLDVSLDGVREVGEGWDGDELGEVLAAPDPEGVVRDTWLEFGDDRQTMVFTSSVAQAHSLARRFREAHVEFHAIDHKTPKRQRDSMLEAYKDKRIRGIVNVGIFTEGFDSPETSCLLQVRPTGSDLVYCQMIGRVLRTWPGKDAALIFDFVPATHRDLRLAGDLLDGKPREERKAEKKAEQAGVILDVFGIDRDGNGIDGDPDEVILRVLDYLSQSHLAWTSAGGIATATVNKENTLVVALPQDGWETPQEIEGRLRKADTLRGTDRWRPSYDPVYANLLTEDQASFRLFAVEQKVPVVLGRFADWESATEAAEEYSDDLMDVRLAKKKTAWRGQPASDKQKSLLRNLRAWREGMSKGQAAQAITHVFAKRAVRRWL